MRKSEDALLEMMERYHQRNPGRLYTGPSAEMLANEDEHRQRLLRYYENQMEMIRNSGAAMARRSVEHRFFDVVFGGPPGHVSGRFIGVEDEHGAGIRVGEWIERADGYWALRIPRG